VARFIAEIRLLFARFRRRRWRAMGMHEVKSRVSLSLPL
jgi:hypothetical protein